MHIAIIGYGRMGQEVEKTALERGHKISIIIEKNNNDEKSTALFKGSDVAIEFSTPESAHNNIISCFKSDIPVVSGTTGWLDELEGIIEACNKYDSSFLYASNFSIGVNILFSLNKQMAGLMNNLTDYNPSIREEHHIQKLDSPSGTAISLANDIIFECDRIDKWTVEDNVDEGVIGILAKREGSVPGTHTISWDSDIDSISLKHQAHNRKGFALGAVFAAEYIHNKKGVFTMGDILNL